MYRSFVRHGPGWDEYFAAACWIKRTTSDPSIPSAMTPFHLFFGQYPLITLDTLVLQLEDTEATGGLSNLMQSRRNMRDVAEAPKKVHKDKEVARQRRDAEISRPFSGDKFGR